FFSVLAALFLCGCRQSRSPKAVESKPHPAIKRWFEEITQTSGIRFKHEVGPGGKFFMPETVGSGVAVFDYDNDGQLHLYFVQKAGPGSKATNKLFHQEPNGQFRDVSAGSGLDVDGFGMGVAVGDVNNDGRPDVLVTEYQRVRLFLNEGNGK